MQNDFGGTANIFYHADLRYRGGAVRFGFPDKVQQCQRTDDTVQNILEINYSVRVDWGFVVQTILTVFVTWVFIVVLGYFVETLIYTLVHKTKLTSFIVFVAYILCFWGVVSADNAILNAISKSSQVMQSSVEILFFLVINTVLYVASAWLMDKKLSV